MEKCKRCGKTVHILFDDTEYCAKCWYVVEVLGKIVS